MKSKMATNLTGEIIINNRMTINIINNKIIIIINNNNYINLYKKIINIHDRNVVQMLKYATR